MKKIGILLVIVIIALISFTQIKIDRQEKEEFNDKLTQEVFRNEAEVFLKAKEALPDLDDDVSEKLKEAEIDLNSANDAKEAAEATDKYYNIIVDLDIDDGMLAPIEESYNKAISTRKEFNTKVKDKDKVIPLKTKAEK